MPVKNRETLFIKNRETFNGARQHGFDLGMWAMMNLDDLKKPERKFVHDLAALNDLSDAQALDHLLNPENIKASGWRPGAVFEDGSLTELRMGVQWGGAYTKFPRVPSFDLPRVRSVVFAGGCELVEDATIEGAELTELNVHGLKQLTSLTTGVALKTLSILGNTSLAKLDVTASLGLETIDIFELPKLKGGILCWDVQMATIEGMGRLKKRVDMAAQPIATTDVLQSVFALYDASSAWDARIAKAVLAHGNCPLDVALYAYLRFINETYARYSTLGQCPTPSAKNLFRLARQIEKRPVDSWVAAPVTPVAKELDVGDWAKAPSNQLMAMLGVAVEGTPTKRKSTKKTRHMTDAEALERFGEWIAHPMEYGRPAKSLQVVYRKVIPWGYDKTKVFLIQWEMDNGDSFVGITGPFTWTFIALDLSRLEPLLKGTRYRRLINLYCGWYACFLAAQEDNHAALVAKSMDKAAIEAAIPALDTFKLHLGRPEVRVGAELMGSTYATGVSASECTIRLHSEPQVYIDPDGIQHYAVEAEITYAYNGGKVVADYRLFFYTDTKGALKPDIRHMAMTGHGVVDDLPLYHYVGSKVGPWSFQNRVGGLSLWDH